MKSLKRKTFGKLFNIHCRWLQPTGNNQFIIAALAAFLYSQPLEPVTVLFYYLFLNVTRHILLKRNISKHYGSRLKNTKPFFSSITVNAGISLYLSACVILATK